MTVAILYSVKNVPLIIHIKLRSSNDNNNIYIWKTNLIKSLPDLAGHIDNLKETTTSSSIDNIARC